MMPGWLICMILGLAWLVMGVTGKEQAWCTNSCVFIAAAIVIASLS